MRGVSCFCLIVFTQVYSSYLQDTMAYSQSCQYSILHILRSVFKCVLHIILKFSIFTNFNKHQWLKSILSFLKIDLETIIKRTITIKAE